MAPIHKWPASERPRERLLGHGPEVMTDAELLSLILGSSCRGAQGVLETCRELLIQFGGLDGLSRCQPRELMKVPGIGQAKACAISAAMELSRRLESDFSLKGEPLASAEDVYRRLKPMMTRLRQEVFFIVALDAKHRVLAIRQVAMGGVNSVEVHPREVFGALVREAATAVIVAHNHPSGDPEPSVEDEQLTERLHQAAEIIGIPLLDHVILGAEAYVSFAGRGLL